MGQEIMGFFSKLFKGVTNLIGEVVGFLTGVDFDDLNQAQGVLVNKQSNNSALPVIYGTRKVGGTRVFVSTGGNKNEYLYIALALCEGEIESIGDVYINDVISTDSKYSGLLLIDKKTGSDSQTYSTVLAPATDTWGTNHRLRGVAYLAIRLKYDSNVFGGIPDIQCVVNGRKVYDPRSLGTAFSTNPALCLRDYLTNTRYGKGLPSSAINDNSFSSAANTCDTLVTEYSGGSSIKLFECNAVIDTDRKLFDNVKILLQGMRGLMPYQDGEYSLLIDKATSSSYTFDETNTYPDITVKDVGKSRRYNRVRATFINPESNWQEDTVIWPPSGSSEESTYLSEDNNEELQKDIRLNTNTNYYSARDIARIVCRASRENPLSIELTAAPEALEVAVGDVVTVDHPSLGWTGAAVKDFRVLAMQLLDSGDVKLSMQQYSDIYTWQSGSQQPDSLATTLPNPFDVPAPSNLSLTQGVTINDDGTSVSRLVINWTASASEFVVAYIVELAPAGFDPYEVRISTPDASGSDATTYLVQPAYTVQYTVKVRAETDAGTRSPAVSGSITITGDTTAPSPPTSLTATGAVKSILLDWTNPSDKDFSAVDVYRSGTQSGTYTRIASVAGLYGNPSSFADLGLGDAVTYFYKLRARDRSGNVSTYTVAVTASTDAAATTEYGPRNAHGYVYYNASSANPPSTPSATSYDFEASATTQKFTGLSTGWQEDPPEQDGSDGKWWASRFSVVEATYDGTQTITFSSAFESFVFDGLVTFVNLNTELADPASSLITTIDGGHINTGLITLTGDNVAGMAIRLGKANYTSTTAGFWLGNIGTSASIQPRFNIGDSSSFLQWDGSDVVSTGMITNNLVVKDPEGEIILDAGGAGLGIGDGSIIRNGALRDSSKTSLVYLTNTATNPIIDGWETADSSSGSTNTSYWGLQGLFQFSSNHTVRSTGIVPVELGENLYLAVQNFMSSSGTRAWSIQVQFLDSAGAYISQIALPYNSTLWSPTPSSGSPRQISQAVITVPTTSTIRACRIRISGGTGSSYVNIWNVYLGRSPTQITPKTAGTYIADLSVDTLQIANEAVTIPQGASTATTTTPIQPYNTSTPSAWVDGAVATMTWGATQEAPSAFVVNGVFMMPDNGSSSSIRRECNIRILATYTVSGGSSQTDEVASAEIAPEERFPATLACGGKWTSPANLDSGVTFTVQGAIYHPDGAAATGTELHKLKGATTINVMGSKR